MSDYEKIDILSVRMTVDLKDQIVRDAADRGQSLRVWVERAARARLDQAELPLDRRATG